MSDDYDVYDSSGKRVLEIEIPEPDSKKQTISINSPGGEKLVELIITVDVKGEISLSLNRTY